MADLVVGSGDDRADVAPTEQLPVCLGRVGLVTQDLIGSGAGPAGAGTGHRQRLQKWGEHRGVPALSRGDQHHQRTTFAVGEVVDLGAQPAPGPAQGMVRRFGLQIRVVRQVPLWCGPGSWRAGARD